MNSVNTDVDLYTNLGLSAVPQPEQSDGLKLNDFMDLMITELTHQDPFKPMENSELATQISQFATVSGIDDLNSSFSSLSNSLLSDQALQAANLVGHEVLVASQIAPLSAGSSINGVIDLPRSASKVTLRISDSSGALVRELQLGSHEAGKAGFNWDGYDDTGNYMPDGLYRINTLATVDDVEMAPQVLVSAQVDSVSVGAPGQELVLNLNRLGTITLNDVAEIR